MQLQMSCTAQQFGANSSDFCSREVATTNDHLSLYFFHQVINKNEYLLSAYATKEMNEHCKQFSYSKRRHNDTSSLLALNEIKY